MEYVLLRQTNTPNFTRFYVLMVVQDQPVILCHHKCNSGFVFEISLVCKVRKVQNKICLRNTRKAFTL